MTSPLLALFIRSLREDSRLKLTYFARVGLVTVILLFMFSVESERGWSNDIGNDRRATCRGHHRAK